MSDLTGMPVWSALKYHYTEIRWQHMRDMFDQDRQRPVNG